MNLSTTSHPKSARSSADLSTTPSPLIPTSTPYPTLPPLTPSSPPPSPASASPSLKALWNTSRPSSSPSRQRATWLVRTSSPRSGCRSSSSPRSTITACAVLWRLWTGSSASTGQRRGCAPSASGRRRVNGEESSVRYGRRWAGG